MCITKNVIYKICLLILGLTMVPFSSSNAKFVEDFDDSLFFDRWTVSNFDVLGYTIDTSWLIIEEGYTTINPEFSIISRNIQQLVNFTLAIKTTWDNPAGDHYQLLYVKLIDTLSSDTAYYNLRSYKQGDNVIEYNIGGGFNIIAMPGVFTEIIRVMKKDDTLKLLWNDSVINSCYNNKNYSKLELWFGQSKYYEIGMFGIDYICYYNETINIPEDFSNIQRGIEASTHGDTVLVSDGTYTGDGNRDIDFLGKSIIVVSENGPENTIIDCQGDLQNLHRGFYLHSGEDSNTVISGFTVRNAYNEYGGAIYCASSTKIPPCIFAKIQNCIFANNHAGVGGGIYCGYRSFPRIVDCLFLNNSYSGIYFYDGAASLIGCTFFGNFGSNIYITGEAPKVKDKNRAELIIQNCNITYSKSGYGIRRDNAYIPQLSCNNIYGNCDGESIGVNLYPENNNISVDPLYCDTINYNFSVVNTSPCLPQNNNCNVLIGTYGMGCYDLIADIGLENEDVNHVLGHNPIIYWSYYDFEMNPQDSFEVEVGTDMDWSSAEMWDPVAFTSSDTTIMYGGTPLLDSETYYYRVRVNNSHYWSIWHYSYFHMNSIPSIPISVRPANNTILLDYQPTLWIQNSTDGEPDDTLTYGFMVANDTTFGEPDPIWDDSVAEGTDSTGWQVTEPLNENWKYFWSACAFDQYEYSDWGEPQYFWVNAIEETPGDFGAYFPPDTDNAIITDMLTNFWWGEADEPDPLDSVYYTLYISIDSEFNFVNTIDSIWSTEYTLTTDDSLEFGAHYWWKVKATDNTGRSTYSTNIRDFSTWVLGDASGDWQVNILDATFLINYLYKGGTPPNPLIMGDVDGSCSTNILDVTYLINYLYKDGPAPLVGCK